jgi:hypothetical protein
LEEGAYLHVGSDDAVIQVVGIAKVEMMVVMCFGCSRVGTIKNANRLSGIVRIPEPNSRGQI